MAIIISDDLQILNLSSLFEVIPYEVIFQDIVTKLSMKQRLVSKEFCKTINGSRLSIRFRPIPNGPNFWELRRSTLAKFPALKHVEFNGSQHNLNLTVPRDMFRENMHLVSIKLREFVYVVALDLSLSVALRGHREFRKIDIDCSQCNKIDNIPFFQMCRLSNKKHFPLLTIVYAHLDLS